MTLSEEDWSSSDEEGSSSTRCKKEVSRRHSIDLNGKIISESVSDSRTPRPDTESHSNHESNSEVLLRFFLFVVFTLELPTVRRRSFSDSIKNSLQFLYLLFNP